MTQASFHITHPTNSKTDPLNHEHPNPNGTWAKFRHKPIAIHQTHTQFNYLFRWWPDLKHHTEIARSGFIHWWHHTDDRQKWGAACGFIRCHWTLHRLYVLLLDENRPRLIAKRFHLCLLQRLALHQMLDLTVQIRMRRHHFVSFSVTHSLSLSLRSNLHRRDRRFLIIVFWCILLPCFLLRAICGSPADRRARWWGPQRIDRINSKKAH